MNRIAIHKAGHEGAFHITALEGQIVTPFDERPDWAEGYAVALLGERTGWYEQRLGKQLPDSIRKPEMIDVRDLGWIALDHEGSEVEIEADGDYRMDVLAGILNIDREDFDGERNFKDTLAEAEANHSYATHPADEATLEEVEGKSFAEVEKATKTA
ncbi:hypothetical protein LZK73_21985 [Neorhizobium galegae]|nr:hypothetical protein LZK73_21985 [Neorhizobium galegae]